MLSKEEEEARQQLNENFTTVGPILLDLRREKDPVYLAKRVFLNYMTDLNVTQEKEVALNKILSEYFYNAPNMQVMEFLAKDPDTKTFMYQFDHHSEKSLIQVTLNLTQEREVAGHGDDMLYLFEMSPHFGNLSLSRPRDLHVRDILVNLWTNFATYGNPTAYGTLGFRWASLVPDGPLHYLSLTTIPTMKLVDGKNRDFWNSLPTKRNKMLYPERFLQDYNESP